MVAGRCVVLLIISARVQRHLDRPLGRAARRAPPAGIGAHEQLAAEPAADIGRDQAHILLGDAKRLRHVARAPVDHLVRGPERELVAIPRGDRGVRLHHRMRLVGRGVGRIELDRRGRERAGEVADCRIGRAAKARLRGRQPMSLAAARSNAPFGRGVVDADQLRRGARLLERFGDHDGDGLVIVVDLRAAEQLGGVELALVELAGVLRRDDRDHAGRGFGRAQVHRP